MLYFRSVVPVQSEESQKKKKCKEKTDAQRKEKCGKKEIFALLYLSIAQSLLSAYFLLFRFILRYLLLRGEQARNRQAWIWAWGERYDWLLTVLWSLIVDFVIYYEKCFGAFQHTLFCGCRAYSTAEVFNIYILNVAFGTFLFSLLIYGDLTIHSAQKFPERKAYEVRALIKWKIAGFFCRFTWMALSAALKILKLCTHKQSAVGNAVK